MKHLTFCITALVLLVGGRAAYAQMTEAAVMQPAQLAARALAFQVGCCTPPAGWRRTDAVNLDRQRGGFDLPSGLVMSLGIDRQVAINGQMVAQSSFNIANVASISPSEASLARDALGARLIQNGPGNFAAVPTLMGTYVQNSLNDQVIGTRTVISANVNSASLMKDLNFNAGLRDATIRGIPTH